LFFDIRYYNADQGGDDYQDTDNCASGAYIFKPNKGDQEAHRYVTPYKQFNFRGSFVSEMHFILVDYIHNYKALLRLRAFKNENITNWEVVTFGIPVTT